MAAKPALAGSQDAAQRAAYRYNYMAQCKIAGFNPNKRFENVLTHLQTTNIAEHHKLLPANFGK